MSLRIEWHPQAIEDVAAFDTDVQRRLQRATYELSQLDDARARLIPYAANLKGFWKLRVGDYRLVCQLIDRDGSAVLIVYVAHRSVAYSARSARTIARRER